MQKILYLAPFCERNVYAENSKYNVKALIKAGADVCIRPYGAKILDLGELEANLGSPEGCSHLIIHGPPDYFQYIKGNFEKCIGITHLPSNKIEDTVYRNYFDIMDMVLVDSSESANHPKCINIRPAIDKNEYNFGPKVFNGQYDFVSVSNPSVRENIFNMVRAFCEEFRAEESVLLTIKIPLEFDAMFLIKFIEKIQSEIPKYNNPTFCPRVAVNNIWMSRKELLDFYNKMDCYININYENRWSRPTLDLIALNKRCISVVDDPFSGTVRSGYGKADFKDFSATKLKQFNIDWMRNQMRMAFNERRDTNLNLQNSLNIEDFYYENVSRKLLNAIYEQPKDKS
jgi:hypothetical protein